MKAKLNENIVSAGEKMREMGVGTAGRMEGSMGNISMLFNPYCELQRIWILIFNSLVIMCHRELLFRLYLTICVLPLSGYRFHSSN